MSGLLECIFGLAAAAVILPVEGAIAVTSWAAEQKEIAANAEKEEKLRREEKAKALIEENERLEEEANRRAIESQKRIAEAKQQQMLEYEIMKLEEEEKRKEEECKKRDELIKERLRREKEEEEKRIADFDANFDSIVEGLIEKREQEIVVEKFEEVLEEMGYDLIAKNESKDDSGEVEATSEMYSFSDGVGLQVIEYDGQVSLEVVGIGTVDRAASEDEKEYIKENMHKLCKKFPEIEERLAKKGVIRRGTLYLEQPEDLSARVQNMSIYDETSEIKTLSETMKKKGNSDGTEESVSLHKVQHKNS